MLVALTGGTYAARSLIASAQRCVNLFSEANPEGSVFPFTYYPTPGLTYLGNSPFLNPIRCLYTASNGVLYAAVTNQVYTVDASWAFTSVGHINPGSFPVSMADNGLTIVVVDGSNLGWAGPLGGTISPITDPAFYGGVRVDYVDTFFIFNKPGTTAFYVSPSEWVNDGSTPFDPLYIATKAGAPDKLNQVVVMHRNLWLIGDRSTEIWYNSGAPDFPFQIQDGAYVDQGTAAPYSIAKMDGVIFWLSNDARGQRRVLMATGYNAKPVSTPAIEAAVWQTFTPGQSIDAIGYCYQLGGHSFYMLTFPTADATWCYDLTTGDWHERTWTDNNGVAHRHRSNCYALAYDIPIVGDFENGVIYALDEANYTDRGQPIVRTRGFPHLARNGQRVAYTQFIAEMEVGTADGTSDGLAAATLDDDSLGDVITTEDDIDITISDAIPDSAPRVTLRYSDTRGQSWGTPLEQTFGGGGDFLTSIQFQRLGMARDRVFELSWSAPVRTALMGAYISTETAET